MATLLQPVVILPNMLLCGFMINLEDIPGYMKPLSDLSFMRYGMAAQLTNIWKSDDYNSIACSAYEKSRNKCAYLAGQCVLDYFSVERGEYWDNIIVLGYMNVGLRILAYIGLRVRACKHQSDTS